jgi:hypothetical protein
LVFDHALRIRLGSSEERHEECCASSSDADITSGSSTAAASEGEGGEDTTVTGGEAAAVSRSDSVTPEEGLEIKGEYKSKNVAGLSNSLLTVDLQAITSGRNFLQIGLHRILRPLLMTIDNWVIQLS